MRRNQNHLRTHLNLATNQPRRGINGTEHPMIKRTLLALTTVASSAAAAIVITLLDQIVHGTLYSYGLQFSYNWADPYWFLLRVIQILLAIGIITTIANQALTIHTYLKTKKQHAQVAPIPRVVRQATATTRNAGKPRPISVRSQSLPSSTKAFPHQRPTQQMNSRPTPTAQPVTTPAQTTPSPSYQPTGSPGLVKCPKCGKSFTQPLRMLDFQSDPPRIVDTCPFCGVTIRQAPHNEEKEQSHENSFLTTRNNHNHQKKTTQ